MANLHIRELREAAGYTQAELAKGVGVTSVMVCQWESGKKTPRRLSCPSSPICSTAPLISFLAGTRLAEKGGTRMARVLLTRREAAERLGVSVNTLDMERSAGHLAYIQRKPGGKVWITEDALTEYLARVTHQARSERKSGVETYRRRRVTP